MASAVRTAFMHGWGIAMTVATASLAAGALVVAARTPKSVDHDLLDETLDLTEPSTAAETSAIRLSAGSH
jgi:hypothetical protein